MAVPVTGPDASLPPETSPCLPGAASAVERMLLRARVGLERLTAREVPGQLATGAVLVDIRPEPQRRRDGELPEAVVICRNVLEWRCDPSSEWRDERLGDGRRLILICNEGFQSSLAAAALQELGRSDATDVVGGFVAWRRAGLPVLSRGSPPR